MSEILKLAHLVDEDRVPKVQIRRRGIKSRLDPQRTSLRKFFREFGFDDQLIAASLNGFHGAIRCCHWGRWQAMEDESLGTETELSDDE
jgi:hypothetical protein